jgi:hypothetical protein
MRLTPIILCVAIATACESSLAPNDFLPRKGVEIVVDSAAYHLQGNTNGWFINVTASVVNNSNQDIYLAQGCGYWRVSRPNQGDPYLALGDYACAVDGFTPAAPHLIAAGERYTQTFRLYGGIQLQARPQILLENNIGPMLFGYTFTDPYATKGVSLTSGAFQVLPQQ